MFFQDIPRCWGGDGDGVRRKWLGECPIRKQMLRHWGWDKIDIFFMNIWPTFFPGVHFQCKVALVQLTTWRRNGGKSLYEPMMVGSVNWRTYRFSASMRLSQAWYYVVEDRVWFVTHLFRPFKHKHHTLRDIILFQAADTLSYKSELDWQLKNYQAHWIAVLSSVDYRLKIIVYGVPLCHYKHTL